MKATIYYKGYGIELSDEIEGTNKASYQIITPPDAEQSEATIVECQNWQNLEKIAQRAVDQLILSLP